MKAPLFYFVLAALASPLSVFSQSKSSQTTLQPPPANLVIDGDLKEWGDSLRYFNQEKKVNYTIANDKEYLYLVLRINDYSEQQRALMAGITFSIDPKGKKKETYSVTFPYTDPGAAPEMRSEPQPGGGAQPNSDDDREQRMQAHLTKLKQIKATGFPDVLNDIITTSNTYGIKTAMNFDAAGYLTYEAQVPISMLHADNAGKNEWAFNIKINGIIHKTPDGNGGRSKEGGDFGGGGMGGGRGGIGGGGGRGGGKGGGGGRRGGGMRGGGQGANTGDRSELAKSVDFWGKYYLGGK
ncbi:hypothetical protein A0256_16030 [Mucilaginibacter sp. PAMC 26640]|nr:hypothetical protein A0256_16030 [Mucilaginibacter sp. PAMC 26640]